LSGTWLGCCGQSAGADRPESRNEREIPELKSPELQRDPGTCFEHPPPYAEARPTDS